MIQQLPGYIFLAIVIAFIYYVNSINLKKNRAIHCRAVMLHLKAKFENDPESTTAEDVANAVRQYNDCAAVFNESISGTLGAVLNVLLRYPEFEIVSEDLNN